jgi:hypothetical protein
MRGRPSPGSLRLATLSHTWERVPTLRDGCDEQRIRTTSFAISGTCGRPVVGSAPLLGTCGEGLEMRHPLAHLWERGPGGEGLA